MVVVVEILVAQRQAKHPLADQRADPMLDQLGGIGVPSSGLEKCRRKTLFAESGLRCTSHL
jgi:hypothetical protein